MSEESVPRRWQAVLDQMFAELATGAPRAESYWAQQLAFGPVFFFAVLLAVRKGAVAPTDLESLRQLIPLALSLLAALPDGSGGDPTRLLLLARRQAVALALDRRRLLHRLATRLGLEASSLSFDSVPSRFLRPYELIGWCPPQPSAADALSPASRLSSVSASPSRVSGKAQRRTGSSFGIRP
jgi:hypothetical protein